MLEGIMKTVKAQAIKTKRPLGKSRNLLKNERQQPRRYLVSKSLRPARAKEVHK
jgi:hypothetical protein